MAANVGAAEKCQNKKQKIKLMSKWNIFGIKNLRMPKPKWHIAKKLLNIITKTSY